MARNDLLYCCPNYAKFSAKPIEGYLTFSESITRKYPGHILSKEGLVNKSEATINMDELLALLRSKDIERYEQEKERFFSPYPKFTTANAQE